MQPKLPHPFRFDLGGGKVLVRGRDGFFLASPNDVYIGRSLILYGEYNRQEADFLKAICDAGDFVVEVGANVGTHTVGLAKRVGPSGRVLAVEAQPVIFRDLCANLALNGLLNVDCRQCGLGAERGTLRLPSVDYGAEGNFGGVSLAADAAGEEVEILRLDDLYRHDRLDLLKIDVEGMEIEVLKGAALAIGRHRPALYVENDRLDSSRALIETLFAMDYRLWWHVPRLFDPDNFFGNPQNAYGNVASFNMVGLPREAGRAMQGMQEVLDAGAHPLRRD